MYFNRYWLFQSSPQMKHLWGLYEDEVWEYIEEAFKISTHRVVPRCIKCKLEENLPLVSMLAGSLGPGVMHKLFQASVCSRGKKSQASISQVTKGVPSLCSAVCSQSNYSPCLPVLSELIPLLHFYVTHRFFSSAGLLLLGVNQLAHSMSLSKKKKAQITKLYAYCYILYT